MKIFDIPLRLHKNKKKFQWLNLNHFRNNGFHLNNKMKKEFDQLFKLISRDKVAPKPPLELHYKIFFRDNRRIDLMNCGSILDKFTSDSLVHVGIIDDDNRNIIKRVIIEDGGIDKHNPRAELEIKKYKEQS